MESSISAPTCDLYHAAINLVRIGSYEASIRILESIAGKNDGVDEDVIHSALSSAYIKIGDGDKAREHALLALDYSKNPMYYANLAQIEMFQFNPLDAIDACELGLQSGDIQEEAKVQLLLKRASAFSMARMHSKSCETLQQLPQEKAEHRVYFGMAQMAEVDPVKFQQGLKDYEARTEMYRPMIPKCVHTSIVHNPRNLSHGLDWNILLEQGIGDCVMMLPYIMDLADLVKSSRGRGAAARVNIISLDGRHDRFVNDIAKYYCDETLKAFCIESQDLYELKMEGGDFIWMFDLLKAGIKKRSGYLEMDKQIVDLSSQHRGKIGICWRGNPAHLNDHWRSAEIESFEPIMSRYDGFGGRKCISLQQNLSPIEHEWLNVYGVDRFTTTGLTALIAVMSNLKAVVTVDTAISHIAGGIGVKCVTILPTNADWRWGNNGRGSRFYGDNHHVARQIKSGDWGDPIAEAMRILHEN